MKTVLLPQRCCSCLGPKETFFKAKEVLDHGTIKITYTLEVPICYKCARKVRIFILLKYIVLLMMAGTGLIIGINIDEAKGGDSGYRFGLTVVFSLVGYFIGSAIKDSFYPIYANILGIMFRNKVYQKLFEELNNKSQ